MLNVAVIGLGNMGKFHVKTYSEIKNANLVSICDLRKEILDPFCAQYNCKGYTDLDEMLTNEKIDAVSIAAPTSLHYSIAKKVLKKNINVLIEKPIADSVEKADEMIELAKKNNLILMVGHIERFNPAMQKLKELIDSNALGEIVNLISRRIGVFPPQIKDANVIIDLAVHDMDIFTWLLNKEPISITGHTAKALIENREDCAQLFMDFGKASGFIQVNWVTPVRIRQLLITGTKGYAELDYIDQSLNIYNSSYTKEVDEEGRDSVKFNQTEKQEIQIEKTMPLTTELNHFLDCIKNKKAPLVTGETGKNALKMALTVLKKTGK